MLNENNFCKYSENVKTVDENYIENSTYAILFVVYLFIYFFPFPNIPELASKLGKQKKKQIFQMV